MAETLERTAFVTSRLLEFFTEKELVMQIGHSKEWWSLALLKELIDNALDACEIINRQPTIQVEITDNSFSVSDNGPGLPEDVLRKSLDYMVRVSDKSYYVSPTRGQLGNALKCVYAAPFVMDGEQGCVHIETGSTLYAISITLDRIAQAPSMTLKSQNSRVPSDGTKVTVFWPDSASLLEPQNYHVFYNEPSIVAHDLISEYAMLNPHASFVIRADGDSKTFEATDPEWKKWNPGNPTSAHWYNTDRLRSLIAAYVAAGRESETPKTVREFVKEFRGLAGTAKQKRVTEYAGLHNRTLADLVHDGDIAIPPVERLLSAMQEYSKPVKPGILGKIGKDHLTQRLIQDYNVTEESIRYKCISSIDDDTNLPHVLEVAFGIYSEGLEDKWRTVITGLNWSPTLNIPVREFQNMLQVMRIDRHDPVCVVMHIARPQFEFVDRGKGQLDV